MGFIQDFKEFAFKGNLIDMAVGFVMGTAVAAIVKSFLDNIIMPLIASVFSVPDMSSLKHPLGKNEAGEETWLMWGTFLQNVLDFVILAFVIFIALKTQPKRGKCQSANGNRAQHGRIHRFKGATATANRSGDDFGELVKKLHGSTRVLFV